MSALTSAHGGDDWRPRAGTLRDEIGAAWAECAVDSECGVLRRVLMHRPGPEIDDVTDHRAALWDAPVDPEKAREQHDALADLYRRLGVTVEYLDPPAGAATPNLYFCRDLFVMTPEGAIVARMAGAARAGEERLAAAALAARGVPILMTLRGAAVFEGADIVHLRGGVVLVARGLRTNAEGARQVARLLSEIGLEPVVCEMPYGCGHIDGGVNIVDRRTAIIKPRDLPHTAYEQLVRLGYTVLTAPEPEASAGMAINIVPVAPGVVVMPAGNPQTRKLLEEHDVECHEADVSELKNGGGAVHCMTGVLRRDPLEG